MSEQPIALLPRAEARRVLTSTLDASVNFVSTGDYPGMIEARYVRRGREYFIGYLSCQTGCAKACRFCHLTQTRQTRFVDVSVAELHAQADDILAHYDAVAPSDPARTVHWNFMARGEPLASRVLLEHGDAALGGLVERAVARGLLAKIKISTIMPTGLECVDLARLFPRHAPDLYYSIYSLDADFRRRWLPSAMAPERALAMLAEYQRATRKIVVLHGAFIEGANDSEESVRAICAAVTRAGLRVDVNIVRYNPFSDRQGREPDEAIVERNARLYGELLPEARIKVVPRVGFDVKASCGMFVEGA